MNPNYKFKVGDLFVLDGYHAGKNIVEIGFIAYSTAETVTIKYIYSNDMPSEENVDNNPYEWRYQDMKLYINQVPQKYKKYLDENKLNKLMAKYL